MLPLWIGLTGQYSPRVRQLHNSGICGKQPKPSRMGIEGLIDVTRPGSRECHGISTRSAGARRYYLKAAVAILATLMRKQSRTRRIVLPRGSYSGSLPKPSGRQNIGCEENWAARSVIPGLALLGSEVLFLELFVRLGTAYEWL